MHHKYIGKKHAKLNLLGLSHKFSAFFVWMSVVETIDIYIYGWNNERKKSQLRINISIGTYKVNKLNGLQSATHEYLSSINYGALLHGTPPAALVKWGARGAAKNSHWTPTVTGASVKKHHQENWKSSTTYTL